MSTTYNVNIVGNLTNNNGVLSGFSTNAYATTDNLNIPLTNSVEITLKTTYEAFNDGSMLVVLNGADKMRLQLYSTSCALWRGDGTLICNTSGFSPQLQTGDELVVKLLLDNNNITLNVYENDTLIDTGSGTNSFSSYTISNIILGHYEQRWGDPQYIHGSLDLNGCNVKANNNIVWQGVTRSTLAIPKIGANDIEKVYLGSEEINKIYLGSEVIYEAAPRYIINIDKDSTGDYTQISDTIITNFSYGLFAGITEFPALDYQNPDSEIQFKVNLNSLSTSDINEYQTFFWLTCADNTWLYLRLNDNRIEWGERSATGSNVAAATYRTLPASIVNNWATIRMTYAPSSSLNTTWNCSYSLDDTNFISIGSVSINRQIDYDITNVVLALFVRESNVDPIDGQIDLSECYIKVNGQYIWKGMIPQS